MVENKTAPMPIEKRAKRYLESYSTYGGKRRAKSFRKLGEMEQCQIVESILGESLKPAADGVYYLTCPGVSFHSCKSGRKDCRFTPGDGSNNARTAAPSLNCVHQSCGTVIAEMNRKIRSECGKASVEYMTDHGSTLNNAAAALIIGFDLPDHIAQKLLVEWGKTCTPTHSPLDCGRAVGVALAAYNKSPDEVGYLLRSSKSAATSGGAATSPSSPPIIKKTSFASGGASPALSATASAPIYIGAKGKVAQRARAMITAYQEDHGIDPTVLLLGPDQPEVGPKLCGLKVDRMNHPGISVCRENADGYDG